MGGGFLLEGWEERSWGRSEYGTVVRHLSKNLEGYPRARSRS